ncbi:hypothetical protein H112_02767 [Trichophyton rubrum D6]|uniref:Protein kinase domain-containing protein n=2 Tax=Trichophyton rubrum TaxID=5551 RepID=A0A178EW21_TRIRU|nr:hypothetical protein H100_02774 [Trichophyton rubrum MR850]EZF43727.1 hypothetical protein H102_02766 [Trichophyton rubrum CBS 100081]EZF54320.1 hypothetical protein H103_02778 [Trichophyton rubrum CBS 288.86]EZF65012.1 hypothetical protein H104_02758 [Trichophyton rubrum CBS 289.86]EZF86357.1 hypothetical protein H110_02776 [Trichophyton rubrum MR1448]EZF96946.1 hypothetical protein H113_02778 [Trichophyton rubrum MR1459]EZG18625.1 hypothetical protein H107_02852 [Trichophyton rubrum CBS 
MQEKLSLTREYWGVKPPAGVYLPTAAEILKMCTADDKHPAALAFPSEAPVFWIKYGFAVEWNEVLAQAMAHRELLKLRSHARVPAIFYAFEAGRKVYIVMEYIPGRSGSQILESSSEPAEREAVHRQVAFMVQELLRIPISPNARPAAIDGGKFTHLIFRDYRASRHYHNVDQLEQHFNLFMKMAKREPKIQGLSREPLVFSHPDIWPGNIIIGDDGRTTIIDFAGSSILPSSFVKYSLSSSKKDREYNLMTWVDLPCPDGIDNVKALWAISDPMIMGTASFARAGWRVPGYGNPVPEQVVS